MIYAGSYPISIAEWKGVQILLVHVSIHIVYSIYICTNNATKDYLSFNHHPLSLVLDILSELSTSPSFPVMTRTDRPSAVSLQHRLHLTSVGI